MAVSSGRLGSDYPHPTSRGSLSKGTSRRARSCRAQRRWLRSPASIQALPGDQPQVAFQADASPQLPQPLQRQGHPLVAPCRPDADPLEELRGSVLRFDDPFAPVGENDWEVLA